MNHYLRNYKVKLELLKDILGEENPKAIIFDDMDSAIIGISYKNDLPILAYSYSKCLDMGKISNKELLGQQISIIERAVRVIEQQL